MSSQTHITPANDAISIGVVIPGYGHPKFLAEAIVSACEQNYDGELHVVVVDDGCKFPETGTVTANLMRQYPGKLSYLRQKNGRLPSARNAGIRYLLETNPHLDAIFFLDADNRLQPYSLASYSKALGQDEAIGWAYPDISFFGLSWGADGFDTRQTAPEYSRLKHLIGNISEAGSLVRADAFRRGIMFDETMRNGFEDWDFWLGMLTAGYTGVRAKDAGFFYRRRAESMLADSRRMEEYLIAYMRQKHQSIFQPRSIMTWEHTEAPAFAIMLTDAKSVLLFTDPLCRPKQVSLPDFCTLIEQWANDRRQYFFPTHICVMDQRAWQEILKRKHWLRWIFLSLRENTHLFSVVGFDAGKMPVFEGVMPEQQRPIFQILNVPADGLMWLLRNQAIGAQDIEYTYHHFILPDLMPTDTVAEEMDMSDAMLWLRELLQQVTIRHQSVRHAATRYAGPSAENVRQILYEELCATEEHSPFPVGHGRKRILVAIDINTLCDSDVIDAFTNFLAVLKKANFEVIVAPEVRGKMAYAEAAFDTWLSLCDDIVPFSQQRSKEEFRMYLGRRINAQLTLEAREYASVIVKTVDEVICLGIPGFLEVLGEARQAGAHTAVMLDMGFAVNGADEISKLLAYEHAVSDIVTSQSALHTMLVAEGIPSGKVITYDTFWQGLTRRYQ